MPLHTPPPSDPQHLPDNQDSTKLTDVTLIVTPTSLSLALVPTIGVKPVLLDIKFSGEFEGELLDQQNLERNVLGISRGRMIIVFLGSLQSPFMSIRGIIQVRNAIAYSRDGSKVRATIQHKNDEMKNIHSEWNTSDSKYEELNKTSRGSRVRKTRVTYTLEGKKVTMNEKGKKIRTKK